MLLELEDWMKKKRCSEGNKKKKGKRLKCDKRRNNENWKKCDDRKRRKCCRNGKNTLKRQRMLWYLARCLPRNLEGKERGHALINMLATVVALEERKVEKKLREKRNAKGRRVVNVRKEKARAKADARRKWRVEKAVRKATDLNRNAEERLGLPKKTKHLGKVQLRLQRARCPCRKRQYRQVNLIAIQEVLRLPAEVKAVTKDVDAEAGESCPIPTVLADRVPDHDQSPEVVPEVVHDRDHVHNRDPNPDLYRVRGLDLVQVQNQEVRRDRKAGRDQDQVRQRVDRVRGRDLDQDRGQERVNRDQDRAVVQERAVRKLDQDRALQLVQDQDQGRLVVPEKRRDRDQDRDREAAHNRKVESREARADRNLNLHRGPDRDRVQGQRVDLEVAAPVDRPDLLLQSPENPFRVAMLVPAIRAQTGAVGAKVNRFDFNIKITSNARREFTLTVDYILFCKNQIYI